MAAEGAGGRVERPRSRWEADGRNPASAERAETSGWLTARPSARSASRPAAYADRSGGPSRRSRAALAAIPWAMIAVLAASVIRTNGTTLRRATSGSP